MRITNGMMVDNVLRDINSGMLRMNKYSSQLASNRKMVNLSSDPIGLLNSLNARQRIYQINQYKNNVTTAQKWVTQAENGVRDMDAVIKKVRDALVDAGGPKTASDKDNIATLVKQLKQELVDIGNTAIGSQYIFAGYNTTKHPFTVDANGKVLYNGIDLQMSGDLTAPAGVSDVNWGGTIDPAYGYSVAVSGAGDELEFTDAAGNVVGTVTVPAPVAGENTLDLSQYGMGVITFTSDDPPTAIADDIAAMVAGANGKMQQMGTEASEYIRFEIGYEMTIKASFTGMEVVGLGENNMFKILDDLIADLEADSNTDVLTMHLGKLDALEDRLMKCAVETGARTNKLDMMDSRYELDGISAEQVRSGIEDIDQAYTIMQYKFMASIYEQALAAGAKIIQPTLMDFLR